MGSTEGVHEGLLLGSAVGQSVDGLRVGMLVDGETDEDVGQLEGE